MDKKILIKNGKILQDSENNILVSTLEKGLRGETGATGPKGEVGATGPQGLPGAGFYTTYTSPTREDHT